LFKFALNGSFSKAINIALFSNHIYKRNSTSIDSDFRKRFDFKKGFLKSKIVVKLCCVVTSIDHRIYGSVNPGAFYHV